MTRARLFAVIAVVTALLAGAPSAALAAPDGAVTAPAAAASPAARAAASDYVVAWEHINRGGPRCNFTNSRYWDWVCPGFVNESSSLWNASRTRAMNFFWGSDYTGAWVCLPPTASFHDLTQIRFNKGAGRPGYGQVTNDNIVSSLWAAGSTC